MNRFPVHQDGTTAAVPGFTPSLGTGESELVPQEIQQQSRWINFDFVEVAVDPNFQVHSGHLLGFLIYSSTRLLRLSLSSRKPRPLFACTQPARGYTRTDRTSPLPPQRQHLAAHPKSFPFWFYWDFCGYMSSFPQKNKIAVLKFSNFLNPRAADLIC